MGMEYIDSFDHYSATSDIFRKWTSVGFGTSIDPAGRNGQGLFVTNGGVNKSTQHGGHKFLGAAFNFRATGGQFGSGVIMQFNHGGSTLMSVNVENDGTVTLHCNKSGNPVFASSDPFSLHQGNWYYIEAECQVAAVDDGTGTQVIEVFGSVRIDGTERIPLHSAQTVIPVTTLLLQSATVNNFGFQGSSTGATIDDLYIINDVGPNNTFLGDIQLGVIFPRADVTTQWAPSTGGSDLYKMVNELFPDGDTTYIFDNNPGDKAIFQWEEIDAFTGTFTGVQFSVLARKDNEGSRAFQLIIGVGGADGHSTDFYADDSYVYCILPMDQNPAGGNWTVANFNAQVFGVKETV